MSSQAKQEANRANAQKSTGPTSPEGKANSSRNSVGHGLHASPNTLFASDTEAQTNFAQHIQKLCKECLPEGTLEEEPFRRFPFATFQISRAQALEVQGEIYAYGKEVTFSKVLPIADLRTRDLYKTSAGLIAISLLAFTEKAKLIARTKPNTDPANIATAWNQPKPNEPNHPFP